MLDQQAEALSRAGDWAGQYFRGDKVNSEIYTSPAIFEREMQKIFNATWVYLAHESEIPKDGDFVTRVIGRQPVVVVRGNDGRYHLVMNRCRHRGALICEVERGNQSHFRCFYHGWTYDNTGKLVHIPKDDAYPADFDRDEHSLTPVPRVEAYRGFIFGSVNPAVGPLRDYLGLAAAKMDYMIDSSPTGELRLDAGIHKTTYRGNWKFVGMDGYHPPVVHQSAFEIFKRRAANEHANLDSHTAQVQRKTMNESGLAVSRDLGHGHAMLDVVPHRVSEADFHLAAMRNAPGGERYVADMFAAYGPERATELIAVGGDPHLGVFPNLQMINQHVRVMVPMAVDRTDVYLYPVHLGGVSDEMNEIRLRRHEEFYGAAGMGQPDDTEIFERNTDGLQATVNPWIDISRGRNREYVDADGSIVGQISDEVTQRGQMREWARLMSSS
ncbi:MAG TPA: Rieske 2Fe-2S domain-containing protein [Candidatus Lustribacter sp.]|nr:Rieske 2Fe-2S domain-containing protein [Candidatus Lustribacter sp.]